MLDSKLKLRVNPLFLLIFFLFSLLGLFYELIIAFIIVLLHEFVHLICAFKVGYPISKIEIFPFGGVAEYKGLLEMEPLAEIKVALAGPIFNLSLVATFYFFDFQNILGFQLYEILIRYNLIIGLFNLIPALPLDGGRVLRAILVSIFGWQKGSKLAIKIAKSLAIMGIGLGFLTLFLQQANIWTFFLAFFVYGAAVKEEKQIIYYLLAYLTKRDYTLQQFKIKTISSRVVKGELGIKDIIYSINPVKYNLFFVLDNNLNIAGMITETKLLNSFFQIKDKDKGIKLIDLV